MCPHCLTAYGRCPHCAGADKPLRPPTLASIAMFKLADPRRGVQKSSLTNADREALGIFTKPWRGVAREGARHYHEVAERKPRIMQKFNAVLPAGFALAW